MLENPDVILFLKQYREKSVDFSLYPVCDSEAIRTLDPRLRRALLYPAELRNRPLCVKTDICLFSGAKIVSFFVCAKDFLAFFTISAQRGCFFSCVCSLGLCCWAWRSCLFLFVLLLLYLINHPFQWWYNDFFAVQFYVAFLLELVERFWDVQARFA